MLGAGAGLMIVPMLLNFNLLPRVVAGTSQIVLFFFSWASIIVLVTSAQLETSTILWYLLLGFLGGNKNEISIIYEEHFFNREKRGATFL